MARKLPSGLEQRGRAYYANFMVSGRRVRKRLSSDKKAACEMLNDLRTRTDRDDWGFLDTDYPWSDLREMFMQWARQSVRHPQDYAADLRRFEAFKPIQSVKQVTAGRIDAYRSYRLDHGVTPRTVNREVCTIQNMLNKGVGRFHVIDRNPIAGVKPLAHDSPVKVRRSLSAEEIEAIFQHSPEHLRPVWRVLMTTGIRRGELSAMKFEDIDFDDRSLTIRAATAKSRRARTIPLDDETVDLLAKLRDEAEHRQPHKGRWATAFSRDHVFVTNLNIPLGGDLLRQFYRIGKAAHIDGAEPRGSVDIHSLRGTFITMSIEHGASPKAVQAIVGHSTLDMTMGVYAKATDQSKRQAIRALPFATVSEPAPRLRVIGHNGDQIVTDLPQGSAKPLKNKDETA